jgi:hypothetical protein
MFISLLIDVLFVLFIKYPGVFFNSHFSQPTLFPILSYAPSLTLLIASSLSLSLPLSCLFPTMFSLASVLYKMRLIQTTGIIDAPHLGFAHNN